MQVTYTREAQSNRGEAYPYYVFVILKVAQCALLLSFVFKSEVSE